MSYSESGFGHTTFILSESESELELRMNPVVRDMWTAGLRSGNYLQGVGRLVTVDSRGNYYYCCLGVLCDLAVRAGIIRYGETGQDFRVFAPTGSDGRETVVSIESGTLPEVVARWAGLWVDDPAVDVPAVDVNGYRAYLSWVNDNRDGVTFSEIADMIEDSL